MLERLFWRFASSFLAKVQPQQRWILYLPSHTLGGTPFNGMRPLYATGNTNNAQGGGGFNHPHKPLRLAMCDINHALFLLAFPLLNSFYINSRSLCHELFAAPLQHPHSTLCYFILTHCKSRLSRLYPYTSCHCATPFTPLHLQVWGKTHSAAPFTHPHTRTNHFHALLPYYFIPVP